MWQHTQREHYNLTVASQGMFSALEHTEHPLAEDFSRPKADLGGRIPQEVKRKTDMGLNRLGQEMPPC